MSERDFSYESSNNGLHLTISVIYLGAHLVHDSAIDEFYHVWAYSVRILNKGGHKVRLVSRDWKVINAKGIISEIKGGTAAGGYDQPFIDIGGELSYTSGTYLNEPSGVMVGSYSFFDEVDKKVFSVDIPCFSLDSPQGMQQAN